MNRLILSWFLFFFSLSVSFSLYPLFVYATDGWNMCCGTSTGDFTCSLDCIHAALQMDSIARCVIATETNERKQHVCCVYVFLSEWHCECVLGGMSRRESQTLLLSTPGERVLTLVFSRAQQGQIRCLYIYIFEACLHAFYVFTVSSFRRNQMWNEAVCWILCCIKEQAKKISVYLSSMYRDDFLP